MTLFFLYCFFQWIVNQGFPIQCFLDWWVFGICQVYDIQCSIYAVFTSMICDRHERLMWHVACHMWPARCHWHSGKECFFLVFGWLIGHNDIPWWVRSESSRQTDIRTCLIPWIYFLVPWGSSHDSFFWILWFFARPLFLSRRVIYFTHQPFTSFRNRPGKTMTYLLSTNCQIVSLDLLKASRSRSLYAWNATPGSWTWKNVE